MAWHLWNDEATAATWNQALRRGVAATLYRDLQISPSVWRDKDDKESPSGTKREWNQEPLDSMEVPDLSALNRFLENRMDNAFQAAAKLTLHNVRRVGGASAD